MKLSLIPATLRSIAEKIDLNERISDEDALQLYRSNDLNALGIMASVVRERKNGNVATYILNRYINYSNICVLSCQFCAFAAKKRDPHAFESSIDEIVAAVREALASGITEVHMVGGFIRPRRRSGILTCSAACARSIPICTQSFHGHRNSTPGAANFQHLYSGNALNLARGRSRFASPAAARRFSIRLCAIELCRGKETRGGMA